MLIVFCQSPIDAKSPDEMYQAEAAAATKAGFVKRLIDFEALVHENNIEKAVRNIPQSDGLLKAVYRGWMMRPETYTRLFEALARRGVYLINEPHEFKHCHHLPEWLPELQHVTPQTCVLPLTSPDDLTADNVRECLMPFGDAAVIVKDFVKSEKHHWKDACYIANAVDTNEALRVARNFLKLRGTDLEGGLVFRRFVKFRKLGAHPKSGMPLTEEFRAFVLDGKIMHLVNYWDEVEYPDKAPDMAALLPMVARIPSRFFTVDFARLENGDWMIVELGDGQVAGLTEDADVDGFYQALLAAQSNCRPKPPWNDSRSH